MEHKPGIVLLGAKGCVAAFDQRTGKEIWRTKLAGSGFVTVLCEGGVVIAHTNGQLFGVAFPTGNILWSNPLEGLGYGLGVLATPGGKVAPEVIAEAQRQAEAAAAAATTT